jgi:hypothetical protein
MINQKDFMVCVPKAVGVITPAGRMAYPSLLEARAPQGGGKEKFSVTLLLPKQADITGIEKEIDAAIEKKFGPGAAKKFRIRRPILNTADFPKMGEHAEAFPKFVRLAAQPVDKPTVVKPDGQATEDPAEIYPGRWARAYISAWAYDHTASGKGVSLDLKYVQLLAHAERFAGGRAPISEIFEPVVLSSVEELFS